MYRHRLLFKKEGRAIYISHLDLMRTFQRALLRAGLTVRHTEGFNPHTAMSLALPLPVGCASVCELLDFDLLAGAALEEVPAQLSRVLPEGIAVLDAYEVARKTGEIAWIRVEGTLEYDGGVKDGLTEALLAFYGAKELVILKKSKRGVREFDIGPCIADIAISGLDDNRIHLTAVLSAQDPGLNPSLLIEALRQKAEKLEPEFASFRRLALLDKDNRPFV